MTPSVLAKFTDDLDLAIRAVCPDIHGVTIGDPSNKETWVVLFQDATTVNERAAALAVIGGFDLSRYQK